MQKHINVNMQYNTFILLYI